MTYWVPDDVWDRVADAAESPEVISSDGDRFPQVMFMVPDDDLSCEPDAGDLP